MTEDSKAKRLAVMKAAYEQYLERMEKVIPKTDMRLLAVAKTQAQLSYLAAKEAISTAPVTEEAEANG